MFLIFVQYCASPQYSRVPTVSAMPHMHYNIHLTDHRHSICFGLRYISYMVYNVSLFYTFFFADVVTATDFKKVSNSRERLTVSVFIPNPFVRFSLQVVILRHSYPAVRFVVLRVIPGGLVLPYRIRDLRFLPGVVVISFLPHYCAICLLQYYLVPTSI